MDKGSLMQSTVLVTMVTCMLGAFFLWRHKSTTVVVTDAPHQAQPSSQGQIEAESSPEEEFFDSNEVSISQVSSDYLGWSRELESGLFSSGTKLPEGNTRFHLSSLTGADNKYEVLFYCPRIEKNVENVPSDLPDVTLTEPRNEYPALEIESDVSYVTIRENAKNQLPDLKLTDPRNEYEVLEIESHLDYVTIRENAKNQMDHFEGSKISLFTSILDKSSEVSHQAPPETTAFVKEDCSTEVQHEDAALGVITYNCDTIDVSAKDLAVGTKLVVIAENCDDAANPFGIRAQDSKELDPSDDHFKNEYVSMCEFKDVRSICDESAPKISSQEKAEPSVISEDSDKNSACQQVIPSNEESTELTEPSHEGEASKAESDLTHGTSAEGVDNEVTSHSDSEAVWSYIGKSGPMKEPELNRLIQLRPDSRGNPLQRALEDENVEIIESLLKLGSSLEFRDQRGRYPIHKAASSGNLELMEVLKRWGSDLSGRDSMGYTPLHRAAGMGRTDAVQWLLDQGAPLEAASWAGRTALHLACSRGHLDTARLLIRRGAGVNKQDNQGWTPLYLAKLYQRPELVRLLEEHGGLSREEEQFVVTGTSSIK